MCEALLAVCRYVELNPVAARLVKKPQAWPWSSYRAHVREEPTPDWLDSDGRHGHVLGRPVRTTADRLRGARRYAELVASSPRTPLWEQALRQQIYLGDEAFVERMQALAEPRNRADRDIPKVQRSKARSLDQWLNICTTREEALYRAHTESALSMSAIARQLNLSVSRVSRLIARLEQA